MSIFTIFAGIGQVAGDVFVLCSVLGSAVLLTWRAANVFSSRRHKAPELVVWWTYGGWVFGVFFLVSFVIAESTQTFGWIFLKLDVRAAAGLLLLALLFIVAARLLDGAGNRRRQERRVAAPRR